MALPYVAILCRTFCELFPELLSVLDEQRKAAGAVAKEVVPEKTNDSQTHTEASLVSILSLLIAIVACTWAILAYNV
jgi:hypothetical protein